jgi:excisionase family DNA binding protein
VPKEQNQSQSQSSVEYLTAQQAADAVGVHFQTLLRWIEAGCITGVQKHGNCYLIDADFKIITRYSEAYLKRAIPKGNAA